MIRSCPSCGTKNRVPSSHLADRGTCGRCKQALPPLDAPLEVDDAAFADVVRDARVPVLVDFWAPWCGPCQAAAPEVKKAAHALSGKAIFLKVNTDDHPRLAAQFGVRGIPHFVVLKGGRPVMEQSGVVDARTLMGWAARA